MKLISNISKFYTIIAIISPLLNMYGVSRSYSTFTLREVALIILILICSIDTIETNKVPFVNPWILCYLCAIIVSLTANLISYGNGFVLRTIRYFIILVYVFCFGPKYFNYEYGLRVYRKVVLFSALFLLAQVVSANIFGYYLRGYITWLPLRSKELPFVNGLRRFYSIFEEPGYFGMYSSGYLCLTMMSGRYKWEEILLIIIAMFLSTSTTSIACAILVITFYLLDPKIDIPLTIRPTNSFLKRTFMRLGLIVLVVVSILIFTHTPQYQTVLYRLYYENSTENRFLGYISFDEQFSQLSLFQKVFGNCMDNYSISGYAAMVLSFGIVGTFLLMCSIMTYFVRSSKECKYLILLFLFINISNVEFLGNASTIIVFWGFILASHDGRMNVINKVV